MSPRVSECMCMRAQSMCAAISPLFPLNMFNCLDFHPAFSLKISLSFLFLIEDNPSTVKDSSALFIFTLDYPTKERCGLNLVLFQDRYSSSLHLCLLLSQSLRVNVLLSYRHIYLSVHSLSISIDNVLC